MDPNATLEEMRRLMHAILNEVSTAQEDFANAERLAELVEAMDGWLSRGGFLPRSWQQAGKL